MATVESTSVIDCRLKFVLVVTQLENPVSSAFERESTSAECAVRSLLCFESADVEHDKFLGLVLRNECMQGGAALVALGTLVVRCIKRPSAVAAAAVVVQDIFLQLIDTGFAKAVS